MSDRIGEFLLIIKPKTQSARIQSEQRHRLFAVKTLKRRTIYVFSDIKLFHRVSLKLDSFCFREFLAKSVQFNIKNRFDSFSVNRFCVSTNRLFLELNHKNCVIPIRLGGIKFYFK